MSTNAKLTSQLEASQAYVKKLKDNTAELKLKMKPAWQGQRLVKMMNIKKYWWSHIYQVRNKQTSATCKNSKDGHQKEAMKSNPMGGVK
jgi:hypothetical protein